MEGISMGEGARVDVPELTGIGDAVLDVAGRLDRVATGIETWEYAAQHAVDGAAMCYSEMSYAAMRWQGTLTQLAAEVREFGSELRRTAEDYRAADAAAADRLLR